MNPGRLHVALAVAVGVACATANPAADPILDAPESADTLQPLTPKDTLSVDFPDEDIGLIIRSVGDLFSLKIDLPRNFHGRTSIKLRDVTWRQIFKITLTPAGYDFYEQDGVIIIRTKEEIDALPPVTLIHELFYQRPEETARFLNERYSGRSTFGSAENSVVFRAHPRDVPNIKTEIAQLDLPWTRLYPFPRRVFFPEKLPELKPIPGFLASLGGPPPGDLLTTEIFILKWVDASAVAPYLSEEIPGKDNRVMLDRRMNGLVVSAPESAMPRLQAIVTYLDDKRWYQAHAPAAENAAGPSGPSPAADSSAPEPAPPSAAP